MEIQTTLNLISQRCDFQKNWTSSCVQFFSKNEEKLPHIPFSYKEFSLGLLYYIIRNYNKKINREYFLYSVIRKMNSRQKNVFKIYRNLCEKFGSPSKQIDYDSLWQNIAQYLQMHHYELDFDEYHRLTKIHPAKKFSQIRGLRTLFHTAQKSPKKYTEKQIEGHIINSFLEMRLL
ncbi:MAG: hypothetical protein OEM28_09485 [Nitrosopumilus sp.]|nr:hypothetical protein [Nitrosopumilus sp.]